MNWKFSLSKLRSRKLRVDLYESIEDMPIYNWMKVHETHNLAYVAVLKDYKHFPKIDPEKLMERWKTLYAEYIEEFGISDKYRDYLEKEIQISKMKCDLIINEDETLNTLIRAEQFELDAMLDAKERVKFMDIVTTLTKFLGVRVDTKSVTVLEYYSYIRNFEKANKSASKHG